MTKKWHKKLVAVILFLLAVLFFGVALGILPIPLLMWGGYVDALIGIVFILLGIIALKV